MKFPLLLAAALLLSCGSDSTLPACTPGQSVSCAGPGGCAGQKICAADGRSYTACLCGGAAPDAGVTSDGAASPDVSPPPADATLASDVGASDIPADLPPAPPPDAPVILPFQEVAPCSSESDYTSTRTVTATALLKFSPPCVRVPRGAAVTFMMNFASHPLKRSMSRGDVVNNPIKDTSTGTEATFLFERVGFFGFYCALHGASDNGNNMAGVVWVTDKAPPPPDAGGGGFGALHVVPSVRDFGPVAVGASSDTFTFSVTNTGAGPLGGLAVNVNGADFVAPAADNRCAGVFVLPPGNTCTVGVQFKPGSAGLKSGSIIASAGGQTVTASLTGTGRSPARLIMAPSAAMLAGQVGQTGAPVTFNVANEGDVSTAAVSGALGGTDAGSFAITNNTCLAPLAKGATCTMSVALKAASPGTKSATLTVSSPIGGMATATLTGAVTP